MRAQESLREFERYAATQGVPLPGITCRKALELMTSFFRDVRAENCGIEEGGDALLVEWGTYDWGAGEHFDFHVARQFFLDPGPEALETCIVEDADDRIWHLDLLLQFPPTPALRALGADGHWCQSPQHLGPWMAAVEASKAWPEVRDRADAAVDLRYECAG